MLSGLLKIFMGAYKILVNYLHLPAFLFLLLSSPFITSQELNSNKTILQISKKNNFSTLCKTPSLMLSGINGDSDDSGVRYSGGTTLLLEPGETEFWYSCDDPIGEKEGVCLYEVSYEYSTVTYKIEANSEYLLSCSDDGNIQLLKKVAPIDIK